MQDFIPEQFVELFFKVQEVQRVQILVTIRKSMIASLMTKKNKSVCKEHTFHIQ